MASFRKEKNCWRMQLVCPDGVRRPIRLDIKLRESAVEAICEKIEALVLAKKCQQLPDKLVAEWAANISTDLHNRLAKCGLVDRRINQEATGLATFLDNYIDSRKVELRPNSIRNLTFTRNKLVEKFGATKTLASFIAGDGNTFKLWMLNKPYSKATTSKNIKFARSFFKEAISQQFCHINPFDGVTVGCKAEQNDTRLQYIDRATIDKVIEATPDNEWKLIIALSRYAGLRCPSEHLNLRWEDVNWAESKITINAAKTEARIIPLFKELRPYIQAAWDEAPDGTEYVIRKYRDSTTNLRTQFERIIKRAGITAWPRLFHNLRSSCQTDLANRYPLKVICNWIGNSPQVALKHYMQATQHHFDSATGDSEELEQTTTGATSNEAEKETTQSSRS